MDRYSPGNVDLDRRLIQKTGLPIATVDFELSDVITFELRADMDDRQT